MRNIKSFRYFNHKKNNRKILIILGLILISIYSSHLLFRPGFPSTDDGTWLIIRFSGFLDALRSGQLPVRFLYRLNDGFGYPVSNFLYPLYLYLATPIYLLGFGLVNSIKLILIINGLFSVLFTYFWLNKKFNDSASFVGSIVLILSPYYLFDLYKRGSIGELLTFSIVPFILWQIERRSILFASFGVSMLILAHNTLGFLFLVLIAIYVLLIKEFKLLIKTYFFGFLLSAFFWIPAIIDLTSTVFLSTKVSNFYDYLFSIKDFNLIGISSLLIILGSFLIFIYNKRKKVIIDKFFVFSLFISILIIFLQLPQSKYFWEFFPFRDFIQFPFRLLSILTILLTYMAAYSIENIKKYKWVYGLILILVLIIQASFLFNKINIQKFEEGFYSTNESTTTVSNEYMNKWFDKSKIREDNNKILILSGQGEVSNLSLKPNSLEYNIISESPLKVQANIHYFPGWYVFVNEENVNIDYKTNGLIIFNLNEGENKVKILFKETGIRLFANSLSLIGLLLIFLLLIRIFKLNKK